MTPKEVYDEMQRARKVADMQQEKNREEREIQEARLLELSKKALTVVGELLDGTASIQVINIGNGNTRINIMSSLTKEALERRVPDAC